MLTRSVVRHDPFARGVLQAVVPITPAQREVWLSARMSREANCAYNESLSIVMRGALDVAALGAALKEVVDRHESLRGSFSPDGNLMCINQRIEVDMPVVDLTDLTPGARDAAVQAAARQEVEVPFDLVFGPLVRARLLRLGEAEHVLMATAHHAVCDGWSFDVVLGDLSRVYSARVAGDSAGLEEPTPFSRYALDQRRFQESADAAETKRFWLERFARGAATLDLPVDSERARVRTFNGAREDRMLAPEVFSGLKALSRATGATLVNLLLAAFTAFLHRLTGQQDVIVGIMSAGQLHAGLPHLVGHCVNLLPVQVHIPGDLRFADHLVTVRSILLDIHEHQNYTFGSLLHDLSVRRDRNRIPMLPVTFNVDQKIDQSAITFRGLEVALSSNPRRYENFELFLNVLAMGNDITLQAYYNTDLFRQETIQCRLEEFEALLASIIAEPREQIRRLSLLPPQRRQWLIGDLNATAMERPRWQCTHQLFEEQVAKTPQAIAAEFEGRQLTYEELNSRANKLARALKRRGTGLREVVGVYLDRSLEMLVAMLGIHKAGAAYLPLDPGFPAERIALMLEDSGLSSIVTSQTLAGNRFPLKVAAVCLDRDWPSIEGEDPGDLVTAVDGRDLAYLIYTSGSTGKPKGVEVPHRALLNLLMSMQREPGIKESDRLLAVTTLSFDIAALELLLPLVSGARVRIASRADAVDGARLKRLLIDSRPTMMQATPSTWRLLLDAGWEKADGLKVLCGGEALSRELANRIMKTGAELWNMYGPTETTIWSAVGRVNAGREPPPIGHPISNTQLYVLDQYGNPQVVGIPGELYIGGLGVARGYRNRPELTRDRFLSDPFAGDGSSYMYRTGDLARRRPNGDLEFMGRTDNQVKVRGYRIELGEIEYHLGQHPEVKDSVAVVREDSPGHPRLVAYCVLFDHKKLDAGRLREHLRARVPEYMLPAVFVQMDALPLTPNGKVDRKSLPRVDAGLARGHERQVKPRDELERQLVEIWEEELRLGRVSVRDDFFELGGDSLIAARLFAKIEKTTGRRIPLATLFDTPTIEGIARAIRAEGSAQWSCLVPIRREGSRRPLFLVHGAEGNVLVYRDLAQRLGDDQPVYGLQSAGLRGTATRDLTIESMAEMYLREIRKVQPEGPYYLGGYCLGGTIALEMAQQLVTAGQHVAMVALLETYNVETGKQMIPVHLRFLHSLENVYFHVRNLLYHHGGARMPFFLKKLSTEADRLRAQMSMIMDKLPLGPNSLRRLNYYHVAVRRANDAAQQRYRPRRYHGKLTLFAPITYFTGYRDPSFGWREIAAGGLDIRTVSVYPRGMLVVPFVDDLARQLAVCMRDASNGAQERLGEYA